MFGKMEDAKGTPFASGGSFSGTFSSGIINLGLLG